MTSEQQKALQELLDRQQILDCIHRYCRGVDRFDRDRKKPNTLAIGRYIDHFEKRDGHWAIAGRVCVSECINDLAETVLPEAYRTLLMGNGESSRSLGDVSYQRPLKPRQPCR